MKRIVAINCSPRTGWNTDMMVKEAAKGAKDVGAEAEVIEMSQLERYGGCYSCYACKRGKTIRKCVYPDGLAPVLQKIREADGLIIGSPIYIGDLTAAFHALLERLIYQYCTYNLEHRFEGNEKQIPVLFLITSNAPLWEYEEVGYAQMIDRYKNELANCIGPTELVIADETMMVNDYEKYDWPRFDYEDRRRRRREVFPEQLKAAYEKGKELFG